MSYLNEEEMDWLPEEYDQVPVEDEYREEDTLMDAYDYMMR